QAIRLKPDYAEAHWNLALACLLRGDFARGWREYEWRKQRPGVVLTALKKPFWDGSPLEGRTLLVSSEQGMGDSFQFMRYLPSIKTRFGGKVLWLCQKALIPLVTNSQPAIDGLIPWGDSPPEFDVQVPLVSLPFH